MSFWLRWVCGWVNTMSAIANQTRQELTDELLAMGFDRASLEALVQALKHANVTGYGALTVVLHGGQIAKCDFSGTVKVERTLKKL